MDWYLFLTPLLMLVIVGLLGFVGCGSLFGLDHVESPLAQPTGVVAIPGDGVVTIRWDPYANADSYTVKRGTVSGSYTTTFPPDPETATEVDDRDDVINGTTYFYVVTATVDGKESQRSLEVTATPSAVPLTFLVISKMPGSLRNNFTSWVGMGFVTTGAPISVRTLGRLFAPGNTQPHVLKLVDAMTKMDIPGADTIVSFSAGTVGEFVYGNLATPVTLSPNTTYYLMSQEISGSDNFHDSADTTVTTTPAVSRVFAVFGDGISSYTEAPIDTFVYGPLDLQYVQL